MVTLDILLGIPGVEIERTEITMEGDLHIYVKSTVQGTHCHQCNELISKPHGYGREIKIQHLSIWGRRTFIIISPPRYICEMCDSEPTTTQQGDWQQFPKGFGIELSRGLAWSN